jgi:hypothetical protein
MMSIADRCSVVKSVAKTEKGTGKVTKAAQKASKK